MIVASLLLAVAAVAYLTTRPWRSSVVPPGCQILTDERAAPLIGEVVEREDQIMASADSTHCLLMNDDDGSTGIEATRSGSAKEAAAAFRSDREQKGGGAAPPVEASGIGDEAHRRETTEDGRYRQRLAVRKGRFVFVITVTSDKSAAEVTAWTDALARDYVKRIG
ncbi:hypothetical protein GCM10027589_05630 [Actinocorallia lasiicapitis]